MTYHRLSKIRKSTATGESTANALNLFSGSLSKSRFSSLWFQTCLIFHNIWDNPCHWLIFFKMVETTNQFCCAACSQYKLIIPVILRWHSSGITIKNPSCMNCMDCIVQLGSSHVACRWINHDQSRRGISLVIIIILAGAVPFLHG